MSDVPVLVVIDMQNIFSDPASEWATPDYARASEGIRRIMPVFEDRVVFTRFVAPAEPAGAWRAYYDEWPFALVPPSDPLYDVTDEFDTDGRLVVSSERFGKWGPDLEAALGGSREMVLTGVSTDCCVLSTALPAADAGIHVRVVADACAGLSKADHQRALNAMALYGPLIEATTVDRVLAELG